jgi:hypothetical protein
MEVHAMHHHQFLPPHLAQSQGNNFSEDQIHPDALISSNGIVIPYVAQVVHAGAVPVMSMNMSGGLPYTQPVSANPLVLFELFFELTCLRRG